jgi:hypothetical protein
MAHHDLLGRLVSARGALSKVKEGPTRCHDTRGFLQVFLQAGG